jgi:hypothetical protein
MEAPAGKFRRRALAAPQNVQVTPGFEGLHISWTPVEGATSYIVLRSTSPDGPFVAVASGLTQLHYVDLTAALNTDYYYKIVAQSGAGRGEASAPVQGKRATRELVVAFTGNCYLKTYRPDQGPAEPSQTSMYRAYVFKKVTDGGNVSMTYVAPGELLPGSGFSHGFNAVNRIHITNLTPDTHGNPPPTSQAEVTCIAVNNSDLTDLRWVRLNYTAKVEGFPVWFHGPVLWLSSFQKVTIIY